MTKAEAISKVKKLRNLAASEYGLGNQHAGRAAALKAHTLMQEYKISEAELAATAQAPIANAAQAAPEIRFGKIRIVNGVMIVKGQEVRNEKEFVRQAVEDVMADFFEQFFSFRPKQ